jgi:MFS family permease
VAVSAPLSESDWPPRRSSTPLGLRAGLIGGAALLVLLTGSIVGGQYGGRGGAGIGAGVGAFAGFLIGGLVSSVIENIEANSRSSFNRSALMVGVTLGAITLLIAGAVAGGKLAGELGAAIGAAVGLALGLLGAGLTGFIADAISEVVMAGRGPARLGGILLGGLIGLVAGARYGKVGLIAGFLLGMPISALGLELLAILRPHRIAHPRRVPQPAPTRRTPRFQAPAEPRIEHHFESRREREQREEFDFEPTRSGRPRLRPVQTRLEEPPPIRPGAAQPRPAPREAQIRPAPRRSTDEPTPLLPPSYRRTNRPTGTPPPYRRTSGPSRSASE